MFKQHNEINILSHVIALSMRDNLLAQHKDQLIKLTITQHLVIKLLQSFFLKWESSPHPNIFNTICIERENQFSDCRSGRICKHDSYGAGVAECKQGMTKRCQHQT